MGFFDSLFGGRHSNPARGLEQMYGQIPGMANPYYAPYINAGQNALPELQNQYGQLTGNPGGKLNEIGKNYQQSPGLQFAIQQALQGSGHAAAAGGMAGSPEHEQQNMGLATGLANQDYNNWLGQATGLYGQGLQGQQGLAAGGLQAGGNMADLIANAMAQSANARFRGQQEQNSQRNSLLGGIGKLAGSALSAFNPFSGVGSLFGGGMGGGMYGGG